MSLKLLIGNLCALISMTTFAAVIIISIQAFPLKMSILWAVWFVSTAVCPLLDLPSSVDVPVQKYIPLNTIIIQHPDETLSINTKK
jgi:hypothetical protein